MIPQRTLGRTALPVSALGLGTTEIGFVYGIGPRSVPSDAEAITLLHRAVDLGITFFDTAHHYGQAEECIGRSGIAKKPGVVISTKCGHILDRNESITDKELVAELRTEVEESLKKLRMECIPLVQVHGGSAERIRSGMISDAMNALKSEGKLRYFGISTRGEEAPLAALEDGNFDTLQLAYSILDQRMAERVFREATKHNVGIINRSVLLKGALTPARIHLAPSLTALKTNADAAEKIAQTLDISLPDLAVRFALSNPAIGTVLVGSNKIAHVERAAAAAEEGPLPDAILQKLHALKVDNPLEVDPKNWDTHHIADVQ